MYERDYILELIGEFGRTVSAALRRAAAGEEQAIEDVETEVAELLELDRSVALSLTPDSLVTMMVLSGLGDAVAADVCYALNRVADLREAAGDTDTAGLRRLQARAVAESFGCDPTMAPPELAEIDAELAAQGLGA